jgi:NADPH:quinone reductase-like Zn-dependent oxidoreductase
MAPHYYGTIEDVPEWACCKIRDGENSAVMAAVPLVFSTALYALEQRARIEEGQSVLIHSGAGSLGIAAIQVARMLGAEVFTSVGTKEKREFLKKNFDIKDDHIFDSRSVSFANDVLEVTSGRGVDVILNSMTGDLLHSSWEVLAPFVTFVEVGRRDIADSGRLNMRMFGPGVTFTAFDFTDLFWSTSEAKQRIWSRYAKTPMLTV